jgi:2'-5' RNA ligase
LNDIRYGFYLRPSYEMCLAQAEIHDLLRRQYGLHAAGKFMPHATIKGFFRSQADPEEMVSRLTSTLADLRSFSVSNAGVVPFGQSAIVLNIGQTPEGDKNAALQALHEAALAALLPLVSPDCDFAPRESIGSRFTPHLTLAMADIPPFIFDEVLQFVRDAEPVGPSSFRAEVVHLWEFRSDNWSGPWWETLRWKLIHSWTLPSGD